MYIFDTNQNSSPDELDTKLRRALKVALAKLGKNEQWLADEIKARTGRNISKCLITAWKAEKRHRWRIAAELVPIVCEIVQDDSIQRLLLSYKLRRALALGESTPEIVSLLRSALGEGSKEKAAKELKRRSKR